MKNSQKTTPIQRIEELCEKREITKSAFCRILGVENSYFSNWKKRGFPASRYEEAAYALETTIEYIATGTGEERRSVTANQLAEKYNIECNYSVATLDLIARYRADGSLTLNDLTVLDTVANALAGKNQALSEALLNKKASK